MAKKIVRLAEAFTDAGCYCLAMDTHSKGYLFLMARLPNEEKRKELSINDIRFVEYGSPFWRTFHKDMAWYFVTMKKVEK